MNVKFLFARSRINPVYDEKAHTKQYAWNAKVESENEYTQMILLTWTRYDQYIQQIMQISAMWSHTIDLNLIHVILRDVQGKIDQAITHLSAFKAWKMRPKNKKKYKENINKFMRRRCSNNQINLFCIYLAENRLSRHTEIETAIMFTINNCLPFVEKDKKRNK
ncbi:hypothetical protein RFI_02450 [Reticulomyxa filosa]|uniref:Uncharacterized protein n=1 Tax=Reticulomyxa filosa TaxID=46433 RepID=X6PAG3_RETFI|nr:hypothetical protein RFI_02450 [Reticulomyxa filosa]|eukprot:ETO34637.1 hypothetical protein RFI_02450 [Reticulomyxa filosa]